LVLTLVQLLLSLSVLSDPKQEALKFNTGPADDQSMKSFSPQSAMLGAGTIPLFDWEVQSVVDGICKPPKGIPRRCCMATASAGGDLRYNKDCYEKSFSLYKEVEERALTLLNGMPVFGSNKCDVCTILELLVERNQTMTFQGDSMMRQNYVALECELLRNGVNATFSISKINNPRDKRGYYGAKSVLEISYKGRVPIRYYAMYRPIESMQEEWDIFLKSDIVVFDHGLHFRTNDNDMESFRQMVSGLVNTSKAAGLKTLIWRETSAQHFGHRGGHYVNKTSYGCQSNFLDPFWNPRAEIVKEFDVPTIYFRNFTLEFSELHPGGYDCTHYCTTPFLWAPVFRQLKVLLESNT